MVTLATAIPLGSDLQQLGAGATGGARVSGRRRNIISGVGATRTLTALESGSICLFDRAAGIVYTLPAPVAGMFFEFRTTVTITSNAAKTITDAATTFLVGSMQSLTATSAVSFASTANGTSHVAVSSNGTTTGGVIGDNYCVEAISATQWAVNGMVSGSGTLATPFSTS